MSNYHFMIRFRTPRNWNLNYGGDKYRVRSPFGDVLYTLRASGGGPVKESQWLILENVGGGSLTREDAVRAGTRAKNAILWCGARMRVGTDLGDDRAHFVATQHAIDETRRELGVRLLNAAHGLTVYEEDPELPTRFISGSAEAQIGKNIQQFGRHLYEAIDMDLRLNPRRTLAFELYGLSHFESASRARFLTLVSAIETLTEDQERSPDALELIRELMDVTRAARLSRPEVDSLLGGLRSLKQESISKKGQNLVGRHLGHEQYGGEAAKLFFRRCYNVRSQLVHSGRLADGAVDLRSVVTELDRLVADLLVVSAGLRDD